MLARAVAPLKYNYQKGLSKPELKKLGDPELVFANTFGMTRDEFFADFDSWVYLSEDERKIVIPTVEENTGRLYYP